MSIYYQRNREKLLNQVKEYYENNNDCESKQKINTENYLMKKNIKKENMEEIHIKICLRKMNKD